MAGETFHQHSERIPSSESKDVESGPTCSKAFARLTCLVPSFHQGRVKEEAGKQQSGRTSTRARLTWHALADTMHHDDKIRCEITRVACVSEQFIVRRRCMGQKTARNGHHPRTHVTLTL